MTFDLPLAQMLPMYPPAGVGIMIWLVTLLIDVNENDSALTSTLDKMAVQTTADIMNFLCNSLILLILVRREFLFRSWTLFQNCLLG